jgi:hypothetical protein
MSDPERGAYTPPTDTPLSFDARQPVRGASARPYALIIAILVLITMAGVVVIFYRSGARQAGQPPQIVGAPVASIKSPPPSEGQPQDPGAGLQIYRSESGQPAQSAPAAPTFAPPPEQPQPRTQLPPVVLAPAPTAPIPAPAPLPAAPPAPKPAPLAAAPPAAKAPPPAPKPVAVASKPAPPKPAPPKTIDAALAAAPKTTATGAAVVQIGAFSSKALADKGWTDAAAIAPGAAAGKGKDVQKIDKDGSTLYRTAVTGFAGKAQATAFCDKLKAAGKSCFVR